MIVIQITLNFAGRAITMAQSLRERLIIILTTAIPGFDESSPLSGQINSLQIYALVSMLEKEFGVSIHSIEITSSRFCTVTGILEILEGKLKFHTEM